MERVEFAAAGGLGNTRRVGSGATSRRMPVLAALICMPAILAGCFWVPEQIKAIDNEPGRTTELADQNSFVTTPELLSELEIIESERARIDEPGSNKLTLVEEDSESDS